MKKPHTLRAALLAACAMCLLPAAAHALFTVNFDTDAAGNPIAHGQVLGNSPSVSQFDEYSLANGGIVDGATGGVVGMGIRVDNNNGPDLAVAFDTTKLPTQDPDLIAPFKIPGTNTVHSNPELAYPGNVLIVQENSTGCADNVCNDPDDDADGGKVWFDFTAPVTLFSVDLFDIDEHQNEMVRIELFNSAGAVLATYVNFGTGGDNHSKRILFDSGIMNVATLKVKFSSSGALSNIKGSIPTVSIPEPASALLLAVGLLGLGGRRRR